MGLEKKSFDFLRFHVRAETSLKKNSNAKLLPYTTHFRANIGLGLDTHDTKEGSWTTQHQHNTPVISASSTTKNNIRYSLLRKDTQKKSLYTHAKLAKFEKVIIGGKVGNESIGMSFPVYTNKRERRDIGAYFYFNIPYLSSLYKAR